ncbi:MAG: sulfatase-like hydrolase/transferase [Clostridia bacterium]|nr:sulfatase-like hydrolase/transferase [Clostridia bacterium]
MRPNILFILSDDQGAWAMRCAGNHDIHTPNLDRLAAEGVRFENFYCASPVCSPARASIITGEMPSCHGVHDWLCRGNVQGDAHPYMSEHPHFRSDVGIEYLEGHPSYIAVLAENGYNCALSGKWHLGNQDHPKEGFSGWFTISGGGCAYYSPDFFENGRFTVSHDYVTDVITDRALAFLDELEQKEEPFCLQVHYTAPHSPWTPENHPDEYLALYKDCAFTATPDLPIHPCQQTSAPLGDTPERRRENLTGYYAAISAMDANIGRLLDKLDRDGLADNTVVIFTADNGMNMGHHGIWGKGNGTYPPNMYDTSVKVPFLIRAPFLTRTGITAQRSASHCDLFPTILDIASADYTLNEHQPGSSLCGYLTDGCPDTADSPFIAIYDEYGFVRMLRGERYKLIRRYRHNDDELYDMLEDPDETHNLIDEPALADVVREMSDRLEAWFDRYADPKCDGKNSLTLTGSGQRDLCWETDAFAHWNRMYYSGNDTLDEPVHKL